MVEQRPQWAAMHALISDLGRTLDNVQKTRQEALEITGEAWSDDRLIRAVVGPRGQLVDLEINPRIYRNPNSSALSATILATVKAAVDDANRKTRELLQRAMPAGRDLELPGE